MPADLTASLAEEASFVADYAVGRTRTYRGSYLADRDNVTALSTIQAVRPPQRADESCSPQTL